MLPAVAFNAAAVAVAAFSVVVVAVVMVALVNALIYPPEITTLGELKLPTYNVVNAAPPPLLVIIVGTYKVPVLGENMILLLVYAAPLPVVLS